MRSSVRTGAVCLVVAAAAGGVFVAKAFVRGATNAGAVVSADAASASSVTTPTARRSGRYAAGTEAMYTISLQQSMELGEGARQAGRALALRVEGSLALAYTESEGPLDYVRASLRDVRVHQEGRGPDEGTRAVERELAAPFYVAFDAEGRVVDVYLPKEASSAVRAIHRTVAGAFQLVLRDGATWDTVERDAMGEYRAQYTRGEGTGAVEKRKTDYLRIWNGTALEPIGPGRSVTIASRATVTLGEAMVPRTVDIDERGTVSLGKGLPTATGHVVLAARLRDLRPAPGALGAFARDRDGVATASELAAGDAAAARRREDEALVGGASFASLLAETARMERIGEARTELVARLSALFRLDDRAPLEAEARLRGGAQGSEARALVAALGGASTSESLRALGHVLEDARVTRELRASAAMALGLASSPTSDAAEALVRGARDTDRAVAHASALGAGSAARALRDIDPVAASDAVAELVSQLTKATSMDDEIVLLRALGNAGDARALPLAERALSSPYDSVRIAAVAAVRFIEGPAADALVTRGLADEDDEVRAEALRSAAFRSADAQLHAVALIARRDAAEKVRAAAVDTLAAFAPASRDALRVLRDMATSDPSPDVRAQAAAAAGSG